MAARLLDELRMNVRFRRPATTCTSSGFGLQPKRLHFAYRVQSERLAAKRQDLPAAARCRGTSDRRPTGNVELKPCQLGHQSNGRPSNGAPSNRLAARLERAVLMDLPGDSIECVSAAC
jgi:transposase InsO family protein